MESFKIYNTEKVVNNLILLKRKIYSSLEKNELLSKSKFEDIVSSVIDNEISHESKEMYGSSIDSSTMKFDNIEKLLYVHKLSLTWGQSEEFNHLKYPSSLNLAFRQFNNIFGNRKNLPPIDGYNPNLFVYEGEVFDISKKRENGKIQKDLMINIGYILTNEQIKYKQKFEFVSPTF